MPRTTANPAARAVARSRGSCPCTPFAVQTFAPFVVQTAWGTPRTRTDVASALSIMQRLFRHVADGGMLLL